MRELLSLQTVRAAAAIAAAIGAICMAIALVALVSTVNDQNDTIKDQNRRLEQQDTELACRGQLVAEGDVLRNEVVLWVSRGLRGVVIDDEVAVNTAVQNLARLDDDLIEHNRRRERTIEICSR